MRAPGIEDVAAVFGDGESRAGKSKKMNPLDAISTGATVVITHRVRDGEEAAYDRWLGEIGLRCRASPGHLDLQIIPPIAALMPRYTRLVRHWLFN
jgi:hypothetical protein